jgi:ureidoacrylate peracid hydrolase
VSDRGELNSIGLRQHLVNPVVIKHRYSGFVGTHLDLVPRAGERRSVLVAGVNTNVCVESTLRDACMRDYYAVLVSDSCGALSQAGHEATLHNVTSYFGRVLDSNTIMKHRTLHRVDYKR